MKKNIIIIILLIIIVVLMAFIFKDHYKDIFSKNYVHSISEPINSKIVYFDNALKRYNVKFEKKETDINVDGAIACYSYLIENNTLIYIYKFDIESSEYKKIKSESSIHLTDKNINVDAMANTDIVMVYSENNFNSNIDMINKINKIFKES